MTSPFRIRKFANAFSKTNKPSTALGDIPVVGGAALNASECYRKKHGGIWVGGVVEITTEGVFFSANALNKALHTGPAGNHIPIKNIKSVHREFGWITDIVVIEHEHGEFRFRCFGANGVAKRFASYLASL